MLKKEVFNKGKPPVVPASVPFSSLQSFHVFLKQRPRPRSRAEPSFGSCWRRGTSLSPLPGTSRWPWPCCFSDPQTPHLPVLWERKGLSRRTRALELGSSVSCVALSKWLTLRGLRVLTCRLTGCHGITEVTGKGHSECLVSGRCCELHFCLVKSMVCPRSPCLYSLIITVICKIFTSPLF